MVSFGESTKRNYEMNKCLSLMHLIGWYLVATADKMILLDAQPRGLSALDRRQSKWREVTLSTSPNGKR